MLVTRQKHSASNLKKTNIDDYMYGVSGKRKYQFAFSFKVAGVGNNGCIFSLLFQNGGIIGAWTNGTEVY